MVDSTSSQETRHLESRLGCLVLIFSFLLLFGWLAFRLREDIIAGTSRHLSDSMLILQPTSTDHEESGQTDLWAANPSDGHHQRESGEQQHAVTSDDVNDATNMFSLSCFKCGRAKIEIPEVCDFVPLIEAMPEVDKHIGYCYADIEGHEYPLQEWRETQIDVWEDTAGPPPELPLSLANLSTQQVFEYSLGNKIDMVDQYKNNANIDQGSLEDWNLRTLNTWIEGISTYKGEGHLPFYRPYGLSSDALWVPLKKYQPHIVDKSGVVIGSVTPWVEALALGLGASNITTIEYRKLPEVHEKHRSLLPEEVSKLYRNGSLLFDFAITFSSVEHSGLTRYGDPVDPIGDFKAMAQISCLVKPGGFVFFNVPFGEDSITFNLHRIYGPTRLPYMFENWRPAEYFGHSCVWVMQNARGCSNGWVEMQPDD